MLEEPSQRKVQKVASPTYAAVKILTRTLDNLVEEQEDCEEGSMEWDDLHWIISDILEVLDKALNTYNKAERSKIAPADPLGVLKK